MKNRIARTLHLTWHLLRALSDRFRRIRIWTFRGIFALGAALVILRSYAFQESDLVAYLLGGTLLFLSLFLPIVSFITRILMERHLTAEVHAELADPLAHHPIKSGITVKKCRVPPGFSLTVERVFDHPGVKSPKHLLRGGVTQRRGGESAQRLSDTVVFPHRGVWHLTGLQLHLEDVLGFTSLTWDLPQSLSIEVSAPILPIRPLPIVASSATAGDELSLANERTGDLFDMKQYDPSDGLGKILWKTYARTRQLFVRRPEPALIPEGEVAIYVVANKREDYVVGACRSFVEHLQANQIVVLLGTDASERSPVSSLPDEIRHLLNADVWSESLGSGENFAAYLEALLSSRRFLNRVVVFAPQERTEWSVPLTRAATARGIKLSVAAVPPEFALQTRTNSERRGALTLESITRGVLQSITSNSSESGVGAKDAPSRFTVLQTPPPNHHTRTANLAQSLGQNGGELLLCQRI